MSFELIVAIVAVALMVAAAVAYTVLAKDTGAKAEALKTLKHEIAVRAAVEEKSREIVAAAENRNSPELHDQPGIVPGPALPKWVRRD